jgi:hypothetical protein
MNNWRDHILNEFTPQLSRLTLVADPDGLVLEEGVLTGIHERGFELIPFDDHIAFRYAYESKFRSKWDLGQQTDLVVVLRSVEDDLNSLPYDLLQAGRKLFFSIGELFPNLSYPIVSTLDKGYLDELYQAQKEYNPDRLGDNATKNFILRHVFEIAPETIKNPSRLLRGLLRRHFSGQEIPTALDQRFIQILRQSDIFEDWPLEVIIPDKELFFKFLQERWLLFVSGLTGDSCIQENRETYGLKIPGPSALPFAHDDIRIYIDNLFLDGLLKPVDFNISPDLAESWIKVGIKSDPATNTKHRIEGLLNKIESSMPTESSRHGDWFQFAYRWSELLCLVTQSEPSEITQYKQRYLEIRNKIDQNFIDWSFKRYAGLINLPPAPPVMLHHIPRYLSRFISRDKKDKIALVVIDGLSVDQWIVIREALNSKHSEYLFRENAVFAWIPTITSISRQALFAGKPPVFFPDSIHSTVHAAKKEPLLWTQFWSDQGLNQNEIIFAKELKDFELKINDMEEVFSNPKTKVAGVVINKVDKIMHGMQLGTAGMHNQVKQWADQDHIENLFNTLLNNGYKIFVTADHGNIEAIGYGQPKEGVLSDTRGERVRIYSESSLREQTKDKFTDSYEWEPIGLPEDCFALIASVRSAFIKENNKTVSHGGISIEEVIVPLIRVERRDG